MTPPEATPTSLEILVVDDDLYLLAAIKQTLALNGYTVQTFGNPLEALASIEGHSYASVLADIRMPEMDGMQLLERILERDADLPVILMTGHGDISMAVEAVKKGAYNFLQKPVELGELMEKIGEAKSKKMLVLQQQSQEELRKILKSKSW